MCEEAQKFLTLEKLVFYEFDNFPDTVYSGHKDCKDRYLISSDKESGRKLEKEKRDCSLRAQSYLRHEHH